MNLAELILSRFRGRDDYVAVGMRDGSFSPQKMRPHALDLERRHLAGEHCLGFYLMDERSQVWCSCVDFDSKPQSPDPQWQEKAGMLYESLMKWELSPLLEVSQSGRGCHVWLFFSAPTPAWLPRAWWRAVEKKLGLSFKEVYPRQDQQAGKAFGNLVRYPLWNESHFVSPEGDWKPLDPLAALTEARPILGEDLSLIAFQLGMGELAAEERTAVASVMLPDGEAKMPLRVQKLIDRKGSTLNRRWNGDTAGMKDPSNSALGMSIATELVRLYVPTPEIAAVLRFWGRLRNVEKVERDDWIVLTVRKAYEFVVNRTEEKSAESSVTLKGAAHLYLDQIERGQEIYHGSGISELDDAIDGVAAGEVCVIAARPGHGKSALGVQWIDYLSNKGIAGLLVSEEMAAIQIGKRRVAFISALPEEHRTSQMVPRIRAEVDQYHVGRAPVHVVENCNSIDRAEQIIQQFASIHGVGVVAVDYLQLLTAARIDSRFEVVTEISRRIAQLTKRLGLRMLLLCQLNRSVENRNDNEPRLSDLRESGQIEQDADLVLFCQWPYKFDATQPRQLYRIYAAKRRNGPIRTSRIETVFDDDRQRIGRHVEDDI